MEIGARTLSGDRGLLAFETANEAMQSNETWRFRRATAAAAAGRRPVNRALAPIVLTLGRTFLAL